MPCAPRLAEADAARTPVRADFTLIHKLRVRYNEADLQGVVFNANYLVFADISVSEYFRALRVAMALPPDGFGPFGEGLDCMVRSAELDFRGSARADDLLDLGARIARMGRSSFSFEFAIWRGDELLTVIRNHYVTVTKADWRPAPIGDAFRAGVTAFEAKALA